MYKIYTYVTNAMNKFIICLPFTLYTLYLRKIVFKAIYQEKFVGYI